MPIKLGIVPVTPFEQNCSILVCQETGDAAVVDPGGDIDKILDGVKQLGGTVKKILLTHGHLDHCAAAKDLSEQLGVPIEGPQIDEQFWLDQLPEQTVRLDLVMQRHLYQHVGWKMVIMCKLAM
jgi:hydroxyacylglutathione hydrolase